MSRILVTPEMLLHVAAQCSRAHEQLEAMIHMLNQNIHMLESGWEGTTRSRFYADFQQAHREMTLTTEHIQRTSLELRGIAQRFKLADERVQPIQVAGHVLGAYPMMRGPAGHSAVEDAGRKAEEAWNSVQQEAGKAWDTVKQEAGELWEGVKIGAAQLGNSLKDTAISLYEDPLGTGKEMLYNATIGTVEDIWDTGIWAGRMVFSNEYREKIVADTMKEVDSAGGWSNYLGQQSAMILGGAILNRAGIRGGGPLNKKHDDLGGGNSGGSDGGNGSGNGGDERGDDGDGKKSGNEGTPNANKKFSDMSADEQLDIAKQYSQRAPIEIPENANMKAKSMADGYEQITYKWNDGTYKYEVRWHTRTSGAPADQGNTWVIQRTIPGSGGNKPQSFFKIGENEWVEGYKWYDAIAARKAGTATQEQVRILDQGHWKE
ncbi:WXG100 family type VII secretion target [Paenibacillus lautus]|uniref:WXG100 family type VII secretion target n=1 Tax=Paenibacillus lautus TaxID=1401 RepID=UPI002DB690F6|nr:WXG100 family type VII secretion target [Paenibacillus lautus]MEC0259718.1 WXG100 family type VII secretion target [Paenibacillus lautus]